MTSAVKHADWTALALEPGGRSLIEASAGTGKTWTISVLYLRLLLERKLSPKQIVVTTFTEAAAQELRERIRERILWAERLSEGRAPPSPDPAPDEAWLRARFSSAADAAAAARTDLHRLRLALAELDLAPIGTLHGLCRRILADFPFEAGAAFDPGELVAGDDLVDECADDLWRRLFQGGAPDATDAPGAYLPRSRSELRQALRAVLAPGVTVRVPDADALRASLPPDTVPLLREFAAQEEHCAPTEKGKPNTRLKNALGSLLDWLADPAAKLSDTHRKTLSEPQAHLKPDSCAEPGVGLALERIAQVLRVRSELEHVAQARSWKAWAEWARADIGRRLAVAGQLTFDELIVRVHEALRTNGRGLAQRLFETWPVALVDEFQDTDALQYGILDRIYRDADGAPRGRLVMIGDPKQAIYRFRGGDVDAYLAARRSATDAMKLDVNFRSSPALVEALNEFYAQAGQVLSTRPGHEIRYAPVRASGRGDAYTIDGTACERPLQIHFLRAGDVPESQAERRATALEACADHIVQLLSGAHAVGGRALRPGDIAVLLPGHNDIADLRMRLQARDVPCVSSSRDDVFCSPWARELQVVLHAALHPRDDGAVRAALATRLGGRSWEQLRALNADPESWQRETAVFSEWDAIWRSRGVLAVVRAVIERAGAPLFARADRERALTDLRHLGELLQAHSDALPGRDLLLAWLADQREGRGDEGEAAEEKQLRIESDAECVALMTLHASKGLEFDVVMLPLMWASAGRPGEIALLHEAASGRRVIAFGDAAQRRHAQEAQDERFRLLYVALTRARHACHVYALSPERPRQKGGKKGVDPERAPLDAMLERLLRDGDRPSLPHVAWSDAPWAWPWRRWVASDLTPEAPRTARREPPDAPFQYRYSFSALSHGAGALEERAASDEDAIADPREAEPLPAEAEHPQLAWLAPIAGPEFGNAVHAMFERRRIGQPMAQQHALIRRALRDERVRLRDRAIDDLVPHLAARIQATLDAPLLPGRDPALTLGGLPAHAQRAEMEFDFLLDDVSLRALREVCDFVPGTATQALHGLMNGKIDLVFEHAGRFHVLDYKTNRLGDGRRLSAYAPEHLEATMTDSHYRFQALLYTVAVDRYLRQRIAGYRRSEHLGEAIYLFVRATGIAPQVPRAGVWTHRFDEALLDAVEHIFAGRALTAQVPA
jgi:exodeoxyribonuclease V beta subunit